MGAGTHLVQILEMAADNAFLENAQTLHRVEAGTDPMAGVGTGPDARVAVFDHGHDVFGVPHAVIGVIGPFRMVVKADLNVVFLDQLLDRDRKSTRLNSSHANISYAVFCLKKK